MISLIFCGDYAPCRRFEAIVLERGSAILGNAAIEIKTADFSFVNLECPLTDHQVAINKSGPALRAGPQCASGIADFTVAGLANNHSLDYGVQGLIDTITACRSVGVSTVGAGINLAEAQKIHISKVKGKKLAVIAVAEHEFNQSENNGPGSAPLDPVDNYYQIREAQAKADIVIVTIHGGNEHFHYPRPGLRKLCKHYIDLGVNAVICHHPHVPGAYEIYNGRPIVYSLGNFVFDTLSMVHEWDVGYMAKLKFNEVDCTFEAIEIIPYRQSITVEGVELLRGDERDKAVSKIEALRNAVQENEVWLNEWNSFVKQRTHNYLLRQFFPFTFPGAGRLARNIPIIKLFFNRKNSLAKLNLIRCQSHREVLISVIQAESPRREL